MKGWWTVYQNFNGAGNSYAIEDGQRNEQRGFGHSFADERPELVYHMDADGGSDHPLEDDDMDSPTELTRIQELGDRACRRLEAMSMGVTANVSRVHNVARAKPVVSRWVADVTYFNPQWTGESFFVSGMADSLDDAVAQCAADFAKEWSALLVKRAEKFEARQAERESTGGDAAGLDRLASDLETSAA